MSRISNFLHRKKQKKGASPTSDPQDVSAKQSVQATKTPLPVPPSLAKAFPSSRPAPSTLASKPRPTRPAPPPPSPPQVPPRPLYQSTFADVFASTESDRPTSGEAQRSDADHGDSGRGQSQTGGTGTEPQTIGTGVEPHGGGTAEPESASASSSNDDIFAALSELNSTDSSEQEQRTLTRSEMTPSSLNPFETDAFNLSQTDSYEQQQRTLTRSETTPNSMNPFETDEFNLSQSLTDLFSRSDSNLANAPEGQSRTMPDLSASAVSLDSSMERTRPSPGWHPLLPSETPPRPSNAPPPPPPPPPPFLPSETPPRPRNTPPPLPSALRPHLGRVRPVPKRRTRPPLLPPPPRPAAPAWFPHPLSSQTTRPNKPPRILPFPVAVPTSSAARPSVPYLQKPRANSIPGMISVAPGGDLTMEAEDEMMEHLSCPICLNLYTNPVVFPCLHSLCHLCMVNFKFAKLSFSCPECRVVINEKDIKKNFPLQNMVEAYKRNLKSRQTGSLSSLNTAASDLPEPANAVKPNVVEPEATSTSDIKCSICEFSANRAATFKCVQCKIAFCRTCLNDYHPTIESTPEHTLEVV